MNKKNIRKVIAGILILAVAFCAYLWREKKGEPSTEDFFMVNEEISSTDEGSTKAAIGENEEREKNTILVHVAGAVKNPSVVELQEGMRLFEAVEAAGGFLQEADTNYLNLAEKLIDGEKIYVPLIGEEASMNMVGSSQVGLGQKQALVNINSANFEELQTLTGIGPSTAEKILDYRNTSGKFKKIEDLKNVSGIGEKTFEKFKDKICVN
ncbi:MAG: helix-hairpin-helix domain-containing protein [Anaerovorax sp.]